MPSVVEIPLDQLLSNSNIRNVNPDDPQVKALAESFRENGQKVPISVYPITGNGHYGIRFGHRRFAAASLLGWTALTAVVADPPASETELLVDQYLENEQRAGLSYQEKARAYRAMLESGMAQKDIARQCGVSQSDVSTALSMLTIHPLYLDAVGQGKISPSALEPLNTLGMDDQERLFPAVMQAKTVRKVGSLVRADKLARSEKRVAPADYTDDDEEMTSTEIILLDELQQAIEHVQQAAKYKSDDMTENCRNALGKSIREMTTLLDTFRR